jgi:outer membrane protein assembly factor BamB
MAVRQRCHRLSKLYVATDNGFSSPMTGYNPKSESDTFAMIPNLNPGISYYYKVVAVTSGGNSSASNTITTTTFAAFADALVIIGSDDGYMYALNATTGSQVWSVNLNPAPVGRITFEDIVAGPVISNGVVYIGTFADTLYALDAATGARRWATAAGQTLSTVIVSSAADTNGTLYVGGGDPDLFAINGATGVVKWMAPGKLKWQTPTGSPFVPLNPCFDPDTLAIVCITSWG